MSQESAGDGAKAKNYEHDTLHRGITASIDPFSH
jgi:hypothetical protein